MNPPHGPWHTEEVAANCIEVKDVEGRCIASVICDVDNLSDDDREIARLISAAPELLAALKTLAEHAKRSIDNSGGCDHSVGICLCEEIRAVDSARAALIKATES